MPGSIFQSVVSGKKHYNNFNLGREVLLSGQIGKLIPVQCDEVIPGDRWKQNAAFLCRFAPLSAPAMARFNIHFHTFYVPFRIITAETSRESTYEKFMKSIGKHSSEVPVLPYLYGYSKQQSISFFGVGSLADYLGFPTGDFQIPSNQRVSALPFLAYQRIFQDFYRRDQIEAETVYPVDITQCNMSTASSNTTSNYGGFQNAVWDTLEEGQVRATLFDLFKLQTRNYERDYFTSALPEPQFGDEVIVGDGSVNWLGLNDMTFDSYNGTLSAYTSGFTPGTTDPLVLNASSTAQVSGRDRVDLYYMDTPTVKNLGGAFGYSATVGKNDSFGSALASNLQANTFTVNEFRLAMQLQGIKEKINRVGTRYLEIMQGIYGVRVPDARLQRPVFLGGFKDSLTIGSVMQTSQTTETSKQGTLTGQMSGSASGHLVGGGYEFKEHGYIMTIMSITPRTSYYGGMPRKYMKRYPEEFYLPDFDHLGEQPIYNYELKYTVSDSGNSSFEDESGEVGSINNGIFGYTPRYSEYKSSFSTVHGEFRTTLDNWHVSRDFDETPALNPSFIKAEPEDFDRIFEFQNIENTSNEHFYLQVYLDVVAKRNMSKYSTPYTLY